MFLIAGLLSLAAVGSVVMMGDENVSSIDDEPQPVEDTEQDLGPIEPITAILPSSASDETDEPPQVGGTILAGDAADNDMVGTDKDDQINGYDGQDTINGGVGDDIMHGADGDDSLAGGADDDELHGGSGSDSLQGDDGNDSLFGHFGADQMNGGEGQDSMHGGQDNDTLDGGADNDAVHGNYGDDLLRGGAGQDTLFGGQGDDLITGADDGETGSEATDFLNGGEGQDTIIAGEGDIVTTGAGADTIVLGDWVIQGEAADVMDFESGEDKLLIGWDTDNDPDPEIGIEQDPQNPNVTRVSINGEEIATLLGGGAVLPSDIVLMNEAEIPALSMAG
jgi:Ca2+-binding RTX toxin-like protein